MSTQFQFSANVLKARGALAVAFALTVSPILLACPARADDPNASAATTLSTPTCQALEARCVLHVQRMLGTTAPVDGAPQTPPAHTEEARYHGWFQNQLHQHRHHHEDNSASSGALTMEGCWDSYHKARRTGIWPEHIPYNFAITCTN